MKYGYYAKRGMVWVTKQQCESALWLYIGVLTEVKELLWAIILHILTVLKLCFHKDMKKGKRNIDG